MTAAGAVAASTRRKGRASKVGCFLPLSFHPFGCKFFKKDSTWKHSLELCETIAAALFGIANTSLQHVAAAHHYKSVC